MVVFISSFAKFLETFQCLRRRWYHLLNLHAKIKICHVCQKSANFAGNKARELISSAKICWRAKDNFVYRSITTQSQTQWIITLAFFLLGGRKEGAQWAKFWRRKKFVKSNISISWKIFLTKFHFLQFLKRSKINFWTEKTAKDTISRKKFDLFDFTSFFAWIKKILALCALDPNS